MSSSRARAIPLTSIGYVVVIVSFALLGLFAYGLASGFSTAWIFGVAAGVGFVATVAAFRTVIRQEQETTDQEEILVSANPLIPTEHRSHLEDYLNHVPPRPTGN
ncbi:hypothetical protein [Millisia brevis]|uniref:hypothetical protein n=1 Tax=Millisia brevis TaxID=264148 RepID=UPI00082F841F|nr:hypothetical protein [Millisia brevis]